MTIISAHALQVLARISVEHAAAPFINSALARDDEEMFLGYSVRAPYVRTETPADVAAAIGRTLLVDEFAISRSWTSAETEITITLVSRDGMVEIYVLTDRIALYSMEHPADHEELSANWTLLDRATLDIVSDDELDMAA